MSNESEKRKLIVKVNERLVAIPIDHVLRIIQIVSLKSIPDMPVFFKGLLDLSGEKIPVLDLVSLLEKEKCVDYQLSTPIVICKNEHKKIGLIVDSVENVEVVTNAVNEEGIFKQHGMLTATVDTTEGLALEVDMKKLFEIDLHYESFYP